MAGKPKPRTGPTSWKKGQTGNPGGRSPRVGPNGESLAELCRAKTLPLFERAVEIALNKGTEPKDAISVIFGLMDRGWGRPKTNEEQDGEKKGALSDVLSQLIDKLPG